jgi:hypothetical protein
MASDRSAPRRLTGPLLVVIFTVAVVRLAIVLNLPMLFLPKARHDDGLFMRLGASLASGNWLGDFSQFTLMKGPGYPAFLAITNFSGLSVAATHGLFQFAAILVAAWAVYALTSSRAIAVVTLIILSFYPIAFMPELLRVVRDQIYWAQTISVLLLFAVVFLAPPRACCAAVIGAGLAGSMLGWAWLTREEGAWYLPGLGLLFAGAIAIHRRERRELLALVRNLGVAAAAFLVIYGGFIVGNRLVYGAFVGVDFKEHNFESTLELLADVDVGPRLAYVPVTNLARAEIAKVSPAFAPLSKALAPGQPIFVGWNSLGCVVYPGTCGDIAGGWFMWALRDAAAENGFYQSPAIASESFGRIASEIAAACSTGRLNCRHRWLSYLPPLTVVQWTALPSAMLSALDRIIFLDPSLPVIEEKPSIGRRDAEYLDFLHEPYVDPPIQRSYQLIVRGWYRDTESPDWPIFKVYAEQGLEIQSSITRLASPDLQQHFSDPAADHNRFAISFLCPNICVVATLGAQHRELRITVDHDGPTSTISESAVLYVDSVADGNASQITNPAQNLAARARLWLVRIYTVLIPVLSIAGVFAAIAASWRAIKRRTPDVVLLTALAAWTLVVTRIVLLALIEVSSFPATSMRYAAPAAYLAVIAAILSIVAFTHAVMPWAKFRSGPSPKASHKSPRIS